MRNLNSPRIWAGDKPDGKRPSRAEQVMETVEYKKERLRDLTGIEDELKIFEIYCEIKDLLLKVGLDNLHYRRNTIDDRQGTETELVIENLNEEEVHEFDEVFRKLRIFSFPEPAPETNYVRLIIENKRDLEVLRLMSIFKDLDTAYEDRRRQKQIETEIEAFTQWRKKFEEERTVRLEAQERAEAERITREEVEKAKQEKVLEIERQWDAEKLERQAIRAEEKRKMDEIIDEVLAKIKPQEIDLDIEMDNLDGPFKEVTKFRGFQPNFPHKRVGRKNTEATAKEAKDFLDGVDPIDLDEQIAKYKTLWESGQIVDLEEEPLPWPNGKVDLSIFPKKFIWKLDKQAQRKKCYEYDPITKQTGREVTKAERNEYILQLRELRRKRSELEEEQGIQLPKSKEEVDFEQKVILSLNNLIVWLINDLTSHMRGNEQLRRAKENDADDLYQNAVVGLFHAIDKLDQEKATTTGQVMPYIMASMEGYIRRLHWGEHGMAMQKEQIRVPYHILDIRRKVKKAERLLRSEYPAETNNQLMEARLAVALSKPEIGVLPAGSGVVELQELREKLLTDYEEVAFEILDSEELDVDVQVNQLAQLLHTKPAQELYAERMHLKETLNKVLKTLAPREERVLRLRFFPEGHDPKELYITNYENLYEGEGLTLEETGKRFNVTQERIRQIEAKALRKLKHPSRARPLRTYLDY